MRSRHRRSGSNDLGVLRGKPDERLNADSEKWVPGPRVSSTGPLPILQTFRRNRTLLFAPGLCLVCLPIEQWKIDACPLQPLRPVSV